MLGFTMLHGWLLLEVGEGLTWNLRLGNQGRKLLVDYLYSDLACRHDKSNVPREFLGKQDVRGGAI
jgi:hypothetical protein